MKKCPFLQQKKVHPYIPNPKKLRCALGYYLFSKSDLKEAVVSSLVCCPGHQHLANLLKVLSFSMQ